MPTLILNRDFQHPADGWYQIEALGQHPNRAAGVVQVIDAEAAQAIVDRFNTDAASGRLRHGNEMLIDHEHFADDQDKESRAYGWLQELQNRTDGIYGRIRWTATGKAAVDGGDYRFFSTEYDTADLAPTKDEGGSKMADGKTLPSVRPLRLAGLTLTNMNNNRGQKPITNRSLPTAPLSNQARCAHLNEDGTFKGGFDGCVLHMRTCEGHSEESAKKICGKIAQEVMNRTSEGPLKRELQRGLQPHFAGSGETAEDTTKTKNRHMKQLANALGLADEASEEAILAAMTQIQNRLSELEPLAAENATLKNRVSQFDSEQMDALLAERKITDEKVINRLKPVLAGLSHREERIAFLDDCGFKAKTEPAPARVLNRGNAAKEVPSGPDDQTLTEKIRNRAEELHTKGRSFDSAWKQAQRESLGKG